MIITQENLIGLLNMDLELEMTAAIRYINHAAMLAGITYRDVKNMLNAFAWQEIKHTMILAEQVDYFGGYPSIRVGHVDTSEDNDEMLLYDFEDEVDAIQRYKIRIEQAEQLKEIELAKRLRSILQMEQQHAMYIKKQLCSTIREGNGSNFRIMDTFDFSQQWADKAASVPVRIKKQN